MRSSESFVLCLKVSSCGIIDLWLLILERKGVVVFLAFAFLGHVYFFFFFFQILFSCVSIIPSALENFL